MDRAYPRLASAIRTSILTGWYPDLKAYIDARMRRVSHFISEDLLEGLEALKVERGTPDAARIRRAIAAYLSEK
jgi:hypothetical protein